MFSPGCILPSLNFSFVHSFNTHFILIVPNNTVQCHPLFTNSGKGLSTCCFSLKSQPWKWSFWSGAVTPLHHTSSSCFCPSSDKVLVKLARSCSIRWLEWLTTLAASAKVLAIFPQRSQLYKGFTVTTSHLNKVPGWQGISSHAPLRTGYLRSQWSDWLID